jgi:hypothetical protein
MAANHVVNLVAVQQVWNTALLIFALMYDIIPLIRLPPDHLELA